MQEQASMQEGINHFANAHAQTIATVSGLQQHNAKMSKVLPIIQQQMANLATELGQMQMANQAAPPPQQFTNNYGGRGGGG